MKLITAVALLLSLPVLAEERASPPMPAQFIGHWAGSPAACQSKTDDMVLNIGTEQISWWESTGQLRAVVANGEHEVALIAEMFGEGDSWLSTAVLRLSEDGSQLTDETSVRNQPLVRYRCPQP